MSGPEGPVGLHREPATDGSWIVNEETRHARMIRGAFPDDVPRWVEHQPVCEARPRARAAAEVPDNPDGRCTVCHDPLDPAAALNPPKKEGDPPGPPFDTHPCCDPESVEQRKTTRPPGKRYGPRRWGGRRY